MKRIDSVIPMKTGKARNDNSLIPANAFVLTSSNWNKQAALLFTSL